MVKATDLFVSVSLSFSLCLRSPKACARNALFPGSVNHCTFHCVNCVSGLTLASNKILTKAVLLVKVRSQKTHSYLIASFC